MTQMKMSGVGAALVLALALAGCDSAPPAGSGKDQATASAANPPAAQAPAAATPSAVHPPMGEKHPPHEAAPPHGTQDTAERPQPTIVVPDAVKGKWHAVQLAVRGADNKRREMTVPLDQVIELEGESVQLRAGPFLPSYMSDFNQITSASDKLDNPALRVELLRNGEVVDSGWVFRDLPQFNTLVNAPVDVELLQAIEAEAGK